MWQLAAKALISGLMIVAIAEIGERHQGVTTVGHAQCWPGVVTAVAGETRATGVRAVAAR